MALHEDTYYEEDLERMRMMNQTLRNENDLLRDEIQSLRARVSLGSSGRKGTFEQHDTDGYQQGYDTIREMEQKYHDLVAENKRLRTELRSKTPTRPLHPMNNEAIGQEVEGLREEIKRLRGVIDKYSRSGPPSSAKKDDYRDRSPSPMYTSPTKSGSKQGSLSRHEVYYDRSPESKEVIRLEKEKHRLLEIANQDHENRKRYERALKSLEADYLDKINDLRGQISQMKIDHEREVTELRLKLEHNKARFDNFRKCPNCHHMRQG